MPVRTEKEVSAGGVVYRKADDKIEFVLISPKEGRWCLPKGQVGESEREEESALREVKEETGLKCKIVQKIGTIEYWYFSKERGVRLHKFVHFFLMEYIEGRTENHDWEVIEAKWFDAEEAIEKASFQSERGIIRKALEILRDPF